MLAARRQSLGQRDALLLRPIAQQPAVLDDDDGEAAHHTAEAWPSPFHPRKRHIEDDEARNHDQRVDDGVVVAEERLLRGFADDEQEDEIERRDLAERALAADA